MGIVNTVYWRMASYLILVGRHFIRHIAGPSDGGLTDTDDYSKFVGLDRASPHDQAQADRMAESQMPSSITIFTLAQ